MFAAALVHNAIHAGWWQAAAARSAHLRLAPFAIAHFRKSRARGLPSLRPCLSVVLSRGPFAARERQPQRRLCGGKKERRVVAIYHCSTKPLARSSGPQRGSGHRLPRRRFAWSTSGRASSMITRGAAASSTASSCCPKGLASGAGPSCGTPPRRSRSARTPAPPGNGKWRCRTSSARRSGGSWRCGSPGVWRRSTAARWTWRCMSRTGKATSATGTRTCWPPRAR